MEIFRYADNIEKGKQIGIEKRVQKNDKYYWYLYAIQKIENIYYVYECEIAEENMAEEIVEYENLNKYLNFQDVVGNFPYKYGIRFDEIHTLKGQRIFNADFYQ